MTRYITKPRPGKKQVPVENAILPSSDRPIKESFPLADTDGKSKPKRGKKQAPVEVVDPPSSFSSDEPSSLRDMGFSVSDRTELLALNEESNISGSSVPADTQDSQLHSSVEPSRAISDSVSSRSRSATMRRSMPASMGPSPRRPATQSRRKSNSPIRRNQQRLYEDIRELQNRTELVIPKLPFSRLIREALQEYSDLDMRVTAECLKCLQEASEIYITQLMEDGWRCTKHRDRATLTPKDLRLVLMLRNDSVLMK